MTVWFKNVSNLEELKAEYKKLAKKWHPDMQKNVDSTKIFVEIVSQYDALYKILKNKANNSQDSTDFKQKHSADSSIFRTIIDKLLKFDMINIEIVGSWVWVSGDTYNIRQILAQFGFQWSKGNKKWYWTETPMSKKVKKATSWQYKVEKYGCDTVQKAKTTKNDKKPVR